MRVETIGRAFALAVFVLALPTMVRARGAEHRLALNDAIALALQKNEAILIQRESLAAASAGVTAARGAYDPSLELQGGWSRSTEPVNGSGASPGPLAPEVESAQTGLAIRQLLPTGGALSLRSRVARDKTDGLLASLSPAYNTYVGLELSHPLLRDRAIDAARLSVRVARAARQGATATLHGTLIETVAAVEQAYWTLVADRLSVGVREQAVRLAEQQLGDTRTRIQSGTTPQTELAQPRAELERRRGELLAARETAARAENTLKLLILGDTDDALWSAPIAPAESVTVEMVPVDVDASLQRALSTRPELVAVKAVVDRRRAETAFARDGSWPALDAVVAYDRYGLAGSRNPVGSGGNPPPLLRGDLGQSFETLGRGDFNAVRVGLVLGLPIGNRAARGSAAAARSVERQAEAELTRVRKTIRAEVLDAAAALETTGQRIEATRSGREAAEVQLAAEEDKYATGLSTNFLVLTRQNDLSRARLDEISALTDYRMARTEMGRATGSLIEDRGINVGGLGR